MRWILTLALSLPLLAETRVIGYAQDGRTLIQAEVAEGYSGQGGTMVIGGLDGTRAEIARKAEVIVSLANPGKAAMQFPPTGVPYREHAESWALWRWIEVHAPAEVIVEGADPAGLKGALAQRTPPAEIARRLARTPRQVADQLARVYGHDFNQLTYLPGMALLAQMRMGNVSEVARMAEPYMAPGRDLLNRASSLTLAGHLVFVELARQTGDARYTAAVRKVAELGFTPAGEMQESMPFHTEMSDSYFMAGPITAAAGALTGDGRYFAMVAKHFRFLDKLVLRPDGLFRHSPLTDAAWGRGNAFPLLGMALALAEFPEGHPDRAYVLSSFRNLAGTLAKYQDQDGMWHEIVDEPGSYAETSATAMIATAMLRGIRKGWLDAAEYRPRVDRAWKAVLARTAADGTLLDVCESTNKQPSREDYLYRAALTGKDERGGGMMLQFALEMAGLNP